MDLLLLILILIIPTIAQIGISLNYKKYKQIKNDHGLSGQEVARQILDAHGLNDVYVVETKGELSDHYDSSRKVVRLSSDIFHSETIAAISVAAHECGHAIQDKEGYFMMRVRSLIFPIVKIGTSLSYFIIFIGILLQAFDLVMLGIALTGLGLLFQLVTLPVEFDASKRALKILEDNGYVTDSEHIGCESMLKSAAMTYVAGVIASALQILRLVLAFSRDRD
ncbi:MAG: zinc metallopeptidase [Bacilli bacterium]